MMYSSGGYRLVIRRGPQPNQVYDLNQDMMTLGRDVNNEITVNDPEVSRHHCRLTRGQSGYTLEDLGSTNGTFVNGRRLTGAQPLNVGDLIGLGETVTLAYESAASGSPPPAAAGGGYPQQPAQQSPPQQQMPAGGGYSQQPPPQAAPVGGGYGQQPPYVQQQPMPPYYEDDARGNRSCGLFIGCGIFIVLLLVGWIVAIVVIDTPLDDVRGVNDIVNAVPIPGGSVDNSEQYFDALINNCDVAAASSYVCSDGDDFHSNPANIQPFCTTVLTQVDSVSCKQSGNDVSCEITYLAETNREPEEIIVNITSGRVCGFVSTFDTGQ